MSESSLQVVGADSTQRIDRYWPAEWTPHAATWIAWPHNVETWPGRFEPIEPTFYKMIQILSEAEPVNVLGGPSDTFDRAADALSNLNNVTIHQVATNDVWIRDYGPTFVQDLVQRKLVAVNWKYNAWGGKWPPWDEDAQNATRIANLAGVQLSSCSITCEGGALETDGEGTLLTTSSCLLSASRNPTLSRSEVETSLQAELGIEKVLWIDGGGLAGDDTDSHIDQLVRFTKPATVLAAVSYTSEDENSAKLNSQFACLQKVTDARGRSLQIVPLMTPPPRFIRGARVPESYCNFYIANGIVLVPTFGFRETDEAALKTIAEHFPDRQIIPLDASDLIWGLGAFHCCTQQQPIAP